MPKVLPEVLHRASINCSDFPDYHQLFPVSSVGKTAASRLSAAGSNLARLFDTLNLRNLQGRGECLYRHCKAIHPCKDTHPGNGKAKSSPLTQR